MYTHSPALRGPLLAAAFALLAACAGTPGREEPRFAEARYRAHIERLASDEFEGRAPGTVGEQKTLDYIEQQFKAAGLEPGIDGSYRQAVPAVEIKAHPDPTMEVRGPAGSLSLRNADDVVAWTRRPVPESRITDAEVVFAGYGIVAPEYGWDDYAGLDVRGKLVLVQVNDPGFATRDPALFTGTTMTYYGRWTYKYEEAVRQGAAGLLVIHETRAAGYPWDVPRNGAAQPEFDLRIADPSSQRLALEGWITGPATGRLLELAGQDYAALASAATKRGFRGMPLGVTASFGVRNDVTERVSYNIVGKVTGRERPGEHFVYVAHWDHLGKGEGDGDTIYNGASDNATGVSALIELGRAFAAARPRTARSVTFVAVTLEEYGLLGSEYFADHPSVPVANIVGGLNMDNLYEVGPTRDLTVIGYGASELEAYLRRAAERQGRVLVPEPTPEKGFYYRSDHFNLAKKGVPMLYTKAGVDSPTRGADWGVRWLDDYIANRYHKPSDEYDPAWDVSGTLQDIEIFYEVGAAVANDQAWPNWRPGSEFRAIRDASRRQ